MTIDNRRAFTEALAMLKYLKLLDQIPQKVINKMEKDKDQTWNFSIDKNIPIEEQKTLHSTKALFTHLYITYICKDKEEIKSIREKCRKNSIDKYDVSKMFERRKNSTSNIVENETIESNKLIENKKSIFDKIKDFFLNLFRK